MASSSNRVLATVADECAICCGEKILPTKNPFCGHSFCYMCLKNTLQNDINNCPICRGPLDDSVLFQSRQVNLKMDIPRERETDKFGNVISNGTHEEEEDIKPDVEELKALMNAGNSASSDTHTGQNAMIGGQPGLAPTVASSVGSSAAIAALPPYQPIPDDGLQRFLEAISRGTGIPLQLPFASATPVANERVFWLYSSRSSGWWRFEPRVEQEVEEQFQFSQAGTTSEIFLCGKHYTFDFAQMTQCQKHNPATSRRIKRVTSTQFDKLNVKGIAGVVVPDVWIVE